MNQTKFEAFLETLGNNQREALLRRLQDEVHEERLSTEGKGVYESLLLVLIDELES